ncbi:MAG: hypothetical protein ACSLEZ_01480 [Thiobacillus sp.]
MNALAEKFTSQLARLVPFGKSSDDPLSNIKSTIRWINNLPLGDASKCQSIIHNEIKRFNESSTQYTKDRLAIFMLLDETSRDLQDTLVRQYLSNARMSRAVESQRWHAVYGLYWEVARGYHTFALHLARDASKSQRDERIAIITLRAIRTFGKLLKWRLIRYLPAGEKLWQLLHNLYRLAESEGIHRQFLQAYAEDTFRFSCESAYLHILMLNQANSGSLYPKQIDLIDRWLCHWHNLLQLDNRMDTNTHNFVVDLSSDYGPRRLRKPDTNKPLRFWATADLLHKLKQIQTALHDGTPPAELGLTEFSRSAESIELIDHLLHQWSSLTSREQRRAPRAPVKKLADVVHGLSAITDLMRAASPSDKAPPYGSQLDYIEAEDVKVYGFVTDRTRDRATQMQVQAVSNSAKVERWVINDESECGYGALVESQQKDWLRVGALIGIKSIEVDEWRIGIVRRLIRISTDTRSVGIETLNARATLAMLHDTSTPGYTVNGFDNSGANLPHASLWLAGNTGADSVIIDPVHFVPGKVFQVDGVPGRKFIALGSLIERCEGWMRVVAEPANR